MFVPDRAMSVVRSPSPTQGEAKPSSRSFGRVVVPGAAGVVVADAQAPAKTSAEIKAEAKAKENAAKAEAKAREKVARAEARAKERAARAEAKSKLSSMPKQFADMLIGGGLDGPWSAVANHTSGGVMVYRWNNTYWQFVGTGEGGSIAGQWLDQAIPDMATAKQAEGAWNFAALRLRTVRPLPVLPDKRVVIPCDDVYLQIEPDGSINALPKDPELGMTHALTISAGTEAGQPHVIQPLPPTSRFRQWLEAAQPDAQVRELLQEQCGMTLLPYVCSVAAWWYGVAGAGKSMLAELCEAMQRQVSRLQLDTLGEAFGLEALVGASLIIVDEVEHEKWAEGRFKSLVSGNGISVNRKNEKALLSYHSRAKWIITSNSEPFIRDKSDGTWRRICAVPFTVVLPEVERVDAYHTKLLESEGRLILDWMLQGASRIVRRGGRFLPEHERPELVQRAKMEARTNSDSVLAWICDENVRFEADAFKTKDAVYEHYSRSCTGAMRTILDANAFWRAVRASPKLAGVRNSNRRVEGQQKWCVELAWGAPPRPLKLVTDVKVEPMFTGSPEAYTVSGPGNSGGGSVEADSQVTTLAAAYAEVARRMDEANGLGCSMELDVGSAPGVPHELQAGVIRVTPKYLRQPDGYVVSGGDLPDAPPTRVRSLEEAKAESFRRQPVPFPKF